MNHVSLVRPVKRLTRLDQIETLFRRQLSTLKKYGCHEVGALHSLWEKLFPAVVKRLNYERWMGKDAEEISIHFLPVIPRFTYGLHHLMKMVRVKSYCGGGSPPVKLTGEVWHNPKDFVDIIKGVPTDPYYILEVENGRETVRKDPRDVEKDIGRKEKRRGMTIDEAIALCIHTDVLSHHQLLAVGSRVLGEHVGRIPEVSFGGASPFPPIVGWEAFKIGDRPYEWENYDYGTPVCSTDVISV